MFGNGQVRVIQLTPMRRLMSISCRVVNSMRRPFIIGDARLGWRVVTYSPVRASVAFEQNHVPNEMVRPAVIPVFDSDRPVVLVCQHQQIQHALLE